MCACPGMLRPPSLKQESSAVKSITALSPGTERRPDYTVIVRGTPILKHFSSGCLGPCASTYRGFWIFCRHPKKQKKGPRNSYFRLNSILTRQGLQAVRRFITNQEVALWRRPNSRLKAGTLLEMAQPFLWSDTGSIYHLYLVGSFVSNLVNLCLRKKNQ